MGRVLSRLGGAQHERNDRRDVYKRQVLDTDLVGNKRTDAPNAGPIEGLKEGHNRMKIWG